MSDAPFTDWQKRCQAEIEEEFRAELLPLINSFLADREMPDEARTAAIGRLAGTVGPAGFLGYQVAQLITGYEPASVLARDDDELKAA